MTALRVTTTTSAPIFSGGKAGNDLLKGGKGGDYLDGQDNHVNDQLYGGQGSQDVCDYDYWYNNPYNRDALSGCEFGDADPVYQPA